MNTKTTLLSLLLLVFSSQLSAQIYTTPPSTPVRTMAEWEELQSLVIVWNGGNSGDPWFDILSEIVRHARLETEVIICCDSMGIVDHAQNYLMDKNVDISSKVSFVVAPNNSIWVRDFGPNCVYANDVDSLHIVDWLYNRINRPKDNAIPEILGQHFQLPVFSTSVAPYDLVNTGGNFITDGMGTAFASELVLVNNDQLKNGECGNLNDVIGTSSHTESNIDQIMQDFMGIDRYVKLDQLPFDCIHHVDMHMKLLDEETLLVGQYPAGIGDGPQIESNLQFLLDNVLTAFGTRFKTIRIPMPPQNGQYPPTPGVYNRTYTNAVFVNKTILIPFYEEQFDTMAQRVWQEAMPGFKVVGINCLDLISSRGALHCITKEMGVRDPLRIVHQPIVGILQNAVGPPNYPVTALIQHRSGIASAEVFYRQKNTIIWSSVPMYASAHPDSADYWTGNIPKQEGYLDTLYYYVQASANNGKTQTRPMPGAEGAWRFYIQANISSTETPLAVLKNIYPNPSAGISLIPVQSSAKTQATILLYNSLGALVQTIFAGELPSGTSQYLLDTSALPSGIYLVQLRAGGRDSFQKLIRG